MEYAQVSRRENYAGLPAGQEYREAPCDTFRQSMRWDDGKQDSALGLLIA